MKILVGCEESQAVTKAFRALGHEAYSCDIKPCSGGHPEWHIQGDVFEAINRGGWDMGIFFPDCTYLTCSAEWAYKDGPYHQKVKPGTLVGSARREARENALQFVRDLMNCGIPKIAIENPIGVIGSRIFWYVGGENGSSRWEIFPKKLDYGGRKPDQIIQPYEFGDDASKSTCLWLKGLSLLRTTGYYKPRLVCKRCHENYEYGYDFHSCRGCGIESSFIKPRWGNQTDSGQNKLSPSDNRAELRSKTYPGIAKAMAEQWGKTITN